MFETSIFNWVLVILNCPFQCNEGRVIFHQSTWWQWHWHQWSIFTSKTLAFETYYLTLSWNFKREIFNVHPDSICVTSLPYLWSWPYPRYLRGGWALTWRFALPIRTSNNPFDGLYGKSLRPLFALSLHTNNLGVTVGVIWGHCSSEWILSPTCQIRWSCLWSEAATPAHHPGFSSIILRFWIKYWLSPPPYSLTVLSCAVMVRRCRHLVVNEGIPSRLVTPCFQDENYFLKIKKI